MASSQGFVDDKECPFCGGPNGCRAGDPACWCNTESVPQGLRELVPAHLAMRSCICGDCIRAYKADPAGFAARTGTAVRAGKAP